jgi:adenine/guanine phosphoribosyltransferase-like PRPP-binding protein
MKTFLAIAAVLGFTSSAALADCAGHVTASAKVDKEVTTASVTKSDEKTPEKVVLLKRDRLKSETRVSD